MSGCVNKGWIPRPENKGLLFQGLFHALYGPRTFYLWSRGFEQGRAIIIFSLLNILLIYIKII